MVSTGFGQEQFLRDAEEAYRVSVQSARVLAGDDLRSLALQGAVLDVQAQKQLSDELVCRVVGGSLAMFAFDDHPSLLTSPSRCICYRWGQPFYPMRTVTFMWGATRSAYALRAYIFDATIEDNLVSSDPVLLCIVQKKRLLRVLEIDLRPVVGIQTPRVDNRHKGHYIGDRLAAKVYGRAYASTDKTPERLLQQTFITRLAAEVRDGILCIEDNLGSENIAREKESSRQTFLGAVGGKRGQSPIIRARNSGQGIPGTPYLFRMPIEHAVPDIPSIRLLGGGLRGPGDFEGQPSN